MAEPRRIKSGQRPGSGSGDLPDIPPDIQPKQWSHDKTRAEIVAEVHEQLRSESEQVHPPEELHIVIVRGGDMHVTAQHSNVEVIKAS